MTEQSAVGSRQSAAVELAAAFYDLPAILALREEFATLDPAGEPRAIVAADARVAPPAPQCRGEKVPSAAQRQDANQSSLKAPRPLTRSSPQHGWAGGAKPTVGVLAGSFDPLTNAHIALAQAALGAGGCDLVYLALSRHTVDKEARVRPSDADRALLLRLYVRGHPRLGILLFNRGLYADQAIAARAAFPEAGAIRFIVGFDKARQIFDPRYYTDRDAALRTLFGNVSLLVAPRATDSMDDLATLLDRPENRQFRDTVRALPFDPAYADDSATTVRALARDGQSIAHLVPPETIAFIAELQPYAMSDTRDQPDRYARREALIASLAADSAPNAGRPNLRALLEG
jgi:nicotinamide-nucleotide adenylyltransferase